MNNKKAATQEKILNAAIKLIALNGFKATTTVSIAKEAGLSETIIFKYYRDKSSLLREIVQKAMGQLLDNIDIAPLIEKVEMSKDYPTRDFLKTILVDRFEFMEDNFELVKIVLMEMQYNDELMILAKDKLSVKLFELIGIIEHLLAVKMGVSVEKSRTILRICVATMASLTVQKHLFSLQLKRDEVEKEIDRLLDVIERSANP